MKKKTWSRKKVNKMKNGTNGNEIEKIEVLIRKRKNFKRTTSRTLKNSTRKKTWTPKVKEKKQEDAKRKKRNRKEKEKDKTLKVWNEKNSILR